MSTPPQCSRGNQAGSGSRDGAAARIREAGRNETNSPSISFHFLYLMPMLCLNRVDFWFCMLVVSVRTLYSVVTHTYSIPLLLWTPPVEIIAEGREKFPVLNIGSL